MSPEEFLDHVKKTVTERGGTYGGVLEDVARMWSIYVGQDEDFLNASDVALMMALLKILRARNNQVKTDSYLDLAGYALLANPAIVPPNDQPEEVADEVADEVEDLSAAKVADENPQFELLREQLKEEAELLTDEINNDPRWQKEEDKPKGWNNTPSIPRPQPTKKLRPIEITDEAADA